MRAFTRVLLIASVAIVAAGQTAFAPPVIKTGGVTLHLDAKTLSFRHPGTGHIFKLHLGEELQNTGGVAPVPANLKRVMRSATSSYYESHDQDSSGSYGAAESIYTRDSADYAVNTKIQYQPDSGRLLITEDIGDGAGNRRYILYSRAGVGYKVTYLMPGYVKEPGITAADVIPADIHLLPGDRAEIHGKRVKISDIPHSVHPFSLGG